MPTLLLPPAPEHRGNSTCGPVALSGSVFSVSQLGSSHIGEFDLAQGHLTEFDGVVLLDLLKELRHCRQPKDLEAGLDFSGLLRSAATSEGWKMKDVSSTKATQSCHQSMTPFLHDLMPPQLNLN